MQNWLESFPVATFILVAVTLVGGVDLLIGGELSEDFATWAGIVGVSNGLVAVGRGVAKR